MKIVTKNKKAFFDYEIKETTEAGIVLIGDEVKSLRDGQVSLDEAFATISGGQVNLINCYIAPYKSSFSKKYEPRRTRTLLLKKREINKIFGDLSKKGLTLIPLKIYFNKRNVAKIELGLAKHKKLHDKKKSLREKDIKREAEREIKGRLR